MSRISLKETYDNRSVIAQIAKVTDTAEDAAETVEQKATEINDALTEVNTAVQAAEGAVTTANAASAAAQQSAQTVAGYNTRLTTAEGEIDTLQNDLNSVTLRVTTAEGDIVTIQGRVTALETADGQNVKLTGEHAIGNYAVLLTGNQNKIGVLGFLTSPKNASLYERLGSIGDWIIGKIPTPSQTIIINAIVASREFNGIQIWNISVFTDGRITVTDQLGGTPPTIKHLIKNNEHYLAVTTVGNNVHYSIKWFMCRMGGTIQFMETTTLPIMNDGSYVDVNA